MRFVHRETESLCAEIIGLKDIARSRRGELISRGDDERTNINNVDKWRDIRIIFDRPVSHFVSLFTMF